MKRVSLTKGNVERIETSVKRLLVSSRETLKRQKGRDYVKRWRFHVNEPDYAHAYGILSSLYLLGLLDSTLEVQEMFSRLKDKVLEEDEDWNEAK